MYEADGCSGKIKLTLLHKYATILNNKALVYYPAGMPLIFLVYSLIFAIIIG